MKEILNSENLIEFHNELDNFAKYHQNKGGQEAHKLIKAMWDESKSMIRNGSAEGIARDEGYDYAMESVLKELHKKFVP